MLCVSEDFLSYLLFIHIVGMDGNFWPSWTDFMCVWRCLFWVNMDPQWLHGNFWPSWTDFTWVWRFPLWVNVDSQWVHENFWPSWIDFTWVWRLDFCVALYSHCKHWWHFSTILNWLKGWQKYPKCQVNQDFIVPKVKIKLIIVL